jgi:hypothetical protein
MMISLALSLKRITVLAKSSSMDAQFERLFSAAEDSSSDDDGGCEDSRRRRRVKRRKG